MIRYRVITAPSNSRSFIMGKHDETAEFISPDKYYALRRLTVTLSVVFTIALLGNFASFGLGRWTVPHQSPQEKKWVDPPIVKKEKELPVPKSPPRNIDDEVERMSKEMMAVMLKSCSGVLEIKDYKGLNIKNRKAAVGEKLEGFSELKKGFTYTVYSYNLVQSKERNVVIGHGIAGDKQGFLFQFIWYPGTTKVPLSVRTITAPQGDRIEIGQTP